MDESEITSILCEIARSQSASASARVAALNQLRQMREAASVATPVESPNVVRLAELHGTGKRQSKRPKPSTS
jgi:hypothetical protein